MIVAIILGGLLVIIGLVMMVAYVIISDIME